MNQSETPYQQALREHPPLPNGTRVQYVSSIPGGFGEIIGHGAVYEQNKFQAWVYTIVPHGMRWENREIMFSLQKTDTEVKTI